MGATEGLDLRLLIRRQHRSVVLKVSAQGENLVHLLHKNRSLESLKVLLLGGSRAKV